MWKPIESAPKGDLLELLQDHYLKPALKNPYVSMVEIEVHVLEKIIAALRPSPSEIERLRERIRDLEQPESWHDEDGEYCAIDAESIADYHDLQVGGIMRVYASRLVAVKYAANLAIDYDDDGDINESEIIVFDTLDEAQQAVDAMPKALSAQQAGEV